MYPFFNSHFFFIDKKKVRIKKGSSNKARQNNFLPADIIDCSKKNQKNEKKVGSRKICSIFAFRKRSNVATKNREFAARHSNIHRGVEQLAARWAHNPKVTGSSPVPATKSETGG